MPMLDVPKVAVLCVWLVSEHVVAVSEIVQVLARSSTSNTNLKVHDFPTPGAVDTKQKRFFVVFVIPVVNADGLIVINTTGLHGGVMHDEIEAEVPAIPLMVKYLTAPVLRLVDPVDPIHAIVVSTGGWPGPAITSAGHRTSARIKERDMPTALFLCRSTYLLATDSSGRRCGPSS